MESKHFQKMKYRIDKISDSDKVVLKFNDLTSHLNIFDSELGLPEGVSADFVMRYIMLMYSPGSPGIDMYPQLSKRKTWAMKTLHVEPNEKGEYPFQYNTILLNSNANFRAKLILFLRLQQPEDWAIMIRAEEHLYDLLAEDLPEDPTDQKNHLMNIETLRKQIRDCRERFMQGEISKALENEITRFLAQDNLGIRPEEYMLIAPTPVPPHKAKGNTMFNDIGN